MDKNASAGLETLLQAGERKKYGVYFSMIWDERS
jgi:hypothetical protein